MLLDLVSDLIADFGVKCLVVLPKPGPLVDRLRQVGAECAIIEYGWWAGGKDTNPLAQQQLLQHSVHNIERLAIPRVKSFDPDVIWSQTMVIPWGSIVAARLGKPHIWYITELGEIDHGLQFCLPFGSIIEEISNSSDHVYTCSKYIAETLFSQSGSTVPDVLYNNVRLPPPGAHHIAVPPLSPTCFKMGIFSQVVASKGTEDAVLATIELRRQGRDVSLLVVGGGDPAFVEHLKGVTRRSEAQEAIHFLGYLENPHDVMRITDAVLVCSRAEAFGRVGVEAMLLSKPVLYANAGGVREYMIDGVTGFSYLPAELPSLVEKIDRLMADSELRHRMGHAGRLHAEKLFNKENYSGRAYERLRVSKERGRLAKSEISGLHALLTSPTAATPPRNAPCPCGSGMRYKHCHGKHV